MVPPSLHPSRSARPRSARLPATAGLLLCALAGLSACVEAGGGGVGTAVTVATANPLLGAGAGMATGWATDKVADYQTQRVLGAVAAAGSEAKTEEIVPWSVGDRDRKSTRLNSSH